MWEAKCLRRKSRLEKVGSHTKAQVFYLSCAAAGQSCAGLGRGRRGHGAGGSMPRSIWQVCPAMAGSQGLPPGGACFPSCLALVKALLVKNSQLLLPPFSPPISFVLLLVQGPLWNLLKPGKLGKIFSITCPLYSSPLISLRQYWGKAAPMEKGLGVDGMSCGKNSDPGRKCWLSLCQGSLLTLHRVSIWTWIICCYKQILRWLNGGGTPILAIFSVCKRDFLLVFLIFSILFLN